MKPINIPSPCPQKIGNMNATANGFFCGSCSTVVIDFRTKTNEEILATLHANSSGDICGVLNTSQLSERRNFGFQIMRFAAALVLVFGSMLFQSCGADEERVGKIQDPSAEARRMDSLAHEQMMKNDSLAKTDSTK